jgi:hypothetical protein
VELGVGGQALVQRPAVGRLDQVVQRAGTHRLADGGHVARGGEQQDVRVVLAVALGRRPLAHQDGRRVRRLRENSVGLS